MGFQRMDAKTADPQIRANLPLKFSTKSADRETSKIVFGREVAYKMEDVGGRIVTQDSEKSEVFLKMQAPFWKKRKPIRF